MNNKRNRILFFICLGISWLISFQLLAQSFSIPEKPTFQTAVYDGAQLLQPSEKTALEQKLIHYADSTSTQIVIVTVKSLEGNDASYTAAQWAHQWGIGQADKDNGVMLLVAAEDRKMTIQVGYGLEHLLTDAYSRRIIEQILAPHFRQQDYYGGLDEATNAMFQIFAGEYQNDNPSEADFGILPIIFFILFVAFIILMIYLASKNAKNNGGNRNPNDDDFFGPIILSRGGRGTWGGGFGGGSWGSGSSGGGGFGGGFGGGGFGGGGASGGW